MRARHAGSQGVDRPGRRASRRNQSRRCVPTTPWPFPYRRVRRRHRPLDRKYGDYGRRNGGKRALDSPRSFGHNHHTFYQVAGVYAVLGDTEKATAWLERSVETGFACWPFFRVDPHLASLRAEPAFERLVADLERKFTAIEIRRL